MRYWLYLIGKLAAVTGFACGLRAGVERVLVAAFPARYAHRTLFLRDLPFTFAMLGVWLVSVGLVYLAFWDQRRRCRTCLRRLIMPLTTGSWSNMLVFGRPRIEWICPYGHGTLQAEQLQITGTVSPSWQSRSEDIWKELESLGPARR